MDSQFILMGTWYYRSRWDKSAHQKEKALILDGTMIGPMLTTSMVVATTTLRACIWINKSSNILFTILASSCSIFFFLISFCHFGNNNKNFLKISALSKTGSCRLGISKMHCTLGSNKKNKNFWCCG